ncbi:hypothetical protein F2P81_014182 [Scophthalmus maximus]|uniref:Uncharacterized protein n=1 Tax=Scophthalmus maximus TaxID=52904 RepID=A0A6A4SG36_SCOMX|nr:hypothetical protein F2P81_014182 [Scophthalmus maximus]
MERVINEIRLMVFHSASCLSYTVSDYANALLDYRKGTQMLPFKLKTRNEEEKTTARDSSSRLQIYTKGGLSSSLQLTGPVYVRVGAINVPISSNGAVRRESTLNCPSKSSFQ